MSKSKTKAKTKTKAKPKYSFFKHLAIIIGCCVLIYWLFFASLGLITGHGNELSVPDLENKPLAQVVAELENAGYRIDIDSAYDPNKEPLIVLGQQPAVGKKVKEGRTIFLTVNKETAPSIQMPNLVNLSFRSAEMLLRSNKLILGDTTLKPDLAEGAVLEQLYKGQPITEGTTIEQGSRIDLVIGNGMNNMEFDIPNVVGMNYPEAVAILSVHNLNYTVVFEGMITDTFAASVYTQQPAPLDEEMQPTKVQEGDFVDIKIRQ